jgi:RND family efflux transporter MFP subunit
VLLHTRAFYEAASTAAYRKVDASRAALARTEEELGKTKLVSPLAGYLVLQEIPLETGKRRPQVGDSVWSGQAIATIPDLSQMVVQTRVRETDLHRIHEDMLARLAVEAYPDVALGGRVDFIGNLAESVADSPWKFFSVRMLVDRAEPRLRPGMSVRVSFELGRKTHVIVAPADAVFPCAAGSCCYVRRRGEIWEQPVTVGLANETHVEVKEGLAAGEELLLAVPHGSLRRPPSPAPSA